MGEHDGMEEPCEKTGIGCYWVWCEMCDDMHCDDCYRPRDSFLAEWMPERETGSE